MKRAVISAVVLSLMLSSSALAVNTLPIKQLLVYVSADMTNADTSNVSNATWIATNLIPQAAAAGYNGIVWTDWSFVRYWDMLTGRNAIVWLQNAKILRNACAANHMLCIPAVAPFGYSSSIIPGRDPNLCEGLKVVNAPMIVQNSKIVPQIPDPDGGDLASPWISGFETATNSIPDNWSWVDGWGTKSSLDTTTKHSGNSSLKFCNLAGGNGRICRTLNNLQPYREYHAQVWIKTSNFTSASSVKIVILNGTTGQGLNQANLYTNGGDPDSGVRIATTQDWTQYDITFNTMDLAAGQQINFYMGTWSGSGNTSNIIWFDDLTVEPAGFVNTIRRANCMPTITSSGDNAKTVYVEGRDYTKIGYDAADYAAGGTPNPEAAWITPQQSVTINPGAKGKLAEGTQLRANYWHMAMISDGQQSACMAEPDVFDIVTNQVHHIHSDLNPDGYMLSHDEIRMGGFDGAYHGTQTPGQILASNVSRCITAIRTEQAPVTGANFTTPMIYVWSDMFDPNHNAVTSNTWYYLCHGPHPWMNSWKGLSSNVIIMNWLSGNTNTLNWFAGNSTSNGTLATPCKQILCGYYDGSVSSIDSWLNTAATIKNPDGSNSVIGVMYTTWTQNYGSVAAFATEVGKYASGTWPPAKLP